MVRVSRVEFHGYADCIRLVNANARVTLGHHCGGRVLEYSWQGINLLALDPNQAGWTFEPGGPEIDPWGGRFDIGPEKVIAPHPALWLGPWSAEVDDAGIAELTSPADPTTGARLVREFELDPVSSRLRCTQTMTNASTHDRAWYHWSRTLATGGGIVIVPLTQPSRFPTGYVMYGPDWSANYRPDDPNIRVRDGFLEIMGTPKYPKLCMDSYAGWLAYLARSDRLFVKRFATFPGRMYSDIVAPTLSVWYFEDRLCELEPMGPEERLAPGESAAYTEEWWVLPYKFPERSDALDLTEIADLVRRETSSQPSTRSASCGSSCSPSIAAARRYSSRYTFGRRNRRQPRRWRFGERTSRPAASRTRAQR